MEYPRTVAGRALELARYFPAVVVSGARQSGKTFLVQKSFPRHHYVSLDLPSVAEQAERSAAAFLREHPQPVVIDEVQYAPGLFRHLKAEIDRDRHAMGRFILTGSQQFVLMKGISDSLAGRAAVIELENLSREEISAVRPVPETPGALISLMVRGQFPELWRVPDLPRRDFYASYLATYLERDVRQILNVTSLRDFERFIRVLAARSANMLNKSDVARDVGISVKAVGDWLSVLQASGQIILLEPWFESFAKRIVKTPKVYFRDTGLLCFLLNLDEATLDGSPSMGAVWETFVFSEMRKMAQHGQRQVGFWYYRDQRAREIDFIIETGGRLTFVECKWRDHLTIEDTRHIAAVREDMTVSRSRWRAGASWVIGIPSASYPISEDVSAGRLRDLRGIVEG
ncbi:MAG TPA: ATP-binding protein [Spirochaetia bacterium]|nr:ATP-binding protein [Spirochaetia bacterium]